MEKAYHLPVILQLYILASYMFWSRSYMSFTEHYEQEKRATLQRQTEKQTALRLRLGVVILHKSNSR